MRLAPYASSGTFTSRVLDAGTEVVWSTAEWTAQLPPGTGLSLSARFGNTAASGCDLDGIRGSQRERGLGRRHLTIRSISGHIDW